MDAKTDLIRVLREKNGTVSSRELAQRLGVSVRSIVNYVREINQTYDHLILSSNRGYRFNSSAKLPALYLEEEKEIPANYNERKQRVLERLLIANEHPDLDWMAQSLCISPVTFQNELAKIRAELKPEGLFIKTKNNQLFMIGEEKDRRKAIMRLLNHELKDSYFNLASIQKYFLTANISEIEEIVTRALREYEYFLDDFSLLNYVLHLAILIESEHRENHNDIPIRTDHSGYTPHIQSIVDRIYADLKVQYAITFSREQIYDASILMSTRIVSKDLNKIMFNQLENYVGREVNELLQDIILSVHDVYGIDLKVDNFMVRFAFHLKNLLYRTKNGLSVTSQHFASIQNEFPFLYVISVYIASLINQRFHCSLANSEISYIALHLGVLMEEKKAYEEKVSCVLVILDYLNIASRITTALQSLSSDIYIVNIMTSYDEIEKMQDIDLILTTLPLNPAISIPQVKITMMCGEADLRKILEWTQKIKENRDRQKIIRHIRRFFHPELFLSNTVFHDRQEVIETGCRILLEHGYATKRYRDQINEHEATAPSAYRNIAIPHPLSSEFDSVKKSAILAILCQRPVPWSSHSVDVIFMICLTKEDYPLFKDLFQWITRFFIEEENSRRMKNDLSFDEFINLLSEK